MNKTDKILRGVHVASLALNLPGPAALQRCQQMGADCIKLEPPPPDGQPTSDPMHQYSPAAYTNMHADIQVVALNLKSEDGQKALHDVLATTDVLITSFRKSAMHKLGVDWNTLHEQHPHLSMVAIYGDVDHPDDAGHDLTYQAQNGLVTGLHLPATLVADMAGSLMASEAVLQCVLHQKLHGTGTLVEVGLSQAVAWMARPRTEMAMIDAHALTGGAHVGYRVYACQNGRVAIAALEPHFFRRLGNQVGLDTDAPQAETDARNAQAIADWAIGKTRAQLEAIAREHDIPLETMPA